MLESLAADPDHDQELPFKNSFKASAINFARPSVVVAMMMSKKEDVNDSAVSVIAASLPSPYMCKLSLLVVRTSSPLELLPCS
jgi:hypothetical protein